MLGRIKTVTDLALYTGADIEKLVKIDPENSYASFYIDKPGKNEKRLIEYPKGELAHILDRLCDGFQWLYLNHITPAAYGFIRKIKPCSDPRDIYTNAKRHLGKKYLLNIDLDDFFHQVDIPKLRNLFSDPAIFAFDPPCEQLITRLVTYRGRLPMGSPTSPPLSNFATIALDNDLLAWARRSRFVYTRFVDDMSFSSNLKISATHLAQINEILQSHQFKPDPAKIRFFSPGDVKEVTGLVIADTITVPEDYLAEFEKDIVRFREIRQTAFQYPDNKVFEWLEKLRQVLQGRLAFLKMANGPGHPDYLRFKKELEDIDHAENIEISVSWRYAGYEYC